MEKYRESSVEKYRESSEIPEDLNMINRESSEDLRIGRKYMRNTERQGYGDTQRQEIRIGGPIRLGPIAVHGKRPLPTRSNSVDPPLEGI